MPYEATVYNVFIASPGDVLAERTIARDVIYEWNAVRRPSLNSSAFLSSTARTL